MPSWEAERRLDYIDFRLVTAGHVRRADLVRTFGVSVPQASADLNRFLRRHRGAMRYDKTAKRYEAALGFLSSESLTRRGLTPAAIRAIKALHAQGHPLGWE